MTTYIDLTNRLLRRLNETLLTESDFLSARNLQATAQDAIVDTIRQIYAHKTNWTFLAVQHTQVLTVGQEEYPWPVNFASVDWTSFQILKDDTLGVLNQHLLPITREEWYRRYRDNDYDTGSTGRSYPLNVLPTHGQGYAVTPSPDKAYTLQYRYFKTPDELVNPTDICSIPDKYDFVIIAGALYHMNLFKDNAESTQLSRQHFYDGLNLMVKQAISWPMDAIDTRYKNNRTI